MDPRPALAIGHVSLRVSDVARAAAFYEALGLRPVMKSPGLAICELRGGTHLMLFRARGTPRKGPGDTRRSVATFRGVPPGHTTRVE